MKKIEIPMIMTPEEDFIELLGRSIARELYNLGHGLTGFEAPEVKEAAELHALEQVSEGPTADTPPTLEEMKGVLKETRRRLLGSEAEDKDSPRYKAVMEAVKALALRTAGEKKLSAIAEERREAFCKALIGLRLDEKTGAVTPF